MTNCELQAGGTQTTLLGLAVKINPHSILVRKPQPFWCNIKPHPFLIFNVLPFLCWWPSAWRC